MLKQQLQQKLQQKLSPAQIQVIKMLEIPVLELEERIQQELEDNPALEEGCEINNEPDDADADVDMDAGGDDFQDDYDYDYDDDYQADDDIPDYRLKTNNFSKDDRREDIPFSAGMTFHEHLMTQQGLLQLSPKEHAIVQYIIGNIDEEGYLRRAPEAMVDDIVFLSGISTDDKEMRRLIQIVRQLDPPGVGASDLRECLLLQLERKEKIPSVRTAAIIVKDYFEEFSKKHFDKILRILDIDDDSLKAALSEITRLNPKPGNAWGGDILEKSMSIVIPDFILENDNGKLSVLLNNSNVPELRISNNYNEMLATYSTDKKQSREAKGAALFVKQKIESARWFIDALRQRQETLLQTMKAIVEIQYDFFLEGDDTFLKPMILKDIADKTGLDISTVSRVSNSKYVQTEFGVYPLKHFFSEAITSDSGEEISTKEIKQILQGCIENENKKKPLSDDALSETLKQKGYPIARRTVAKYREQLNIPVARLRKEM
jgi:RNA polymerase sigma-54 factor